VAQQLGNTPTVCRGSYIHPMLIDTFNAGAFGPLWHARPPARPAELLLEERRLLHVLAEAGDQPLLVAGVETNGDRTAIPVKVQLEEARDEVDDAVSDFAAKRRAAN
jgi:hypothetical protein